MRARETRREVVVVEVGHRIRYFRNRSGLTQETLARLSKLTPKFVSQIENGHVNPSIGVLERLVRDGLGLTLGVFFTWDPHNLDISTAFALLAGQTGDARRRVLRVLEVLCEGEPGTARGTHVEVERRRRGRAR